MKKIKILVCCHKSDPDIRRTDIYEPIHLGHEFPTLEECQWSDGMRIRGGGTIFEKNKSYCELTALYWAWKEMPKTDYVGLAHYRRYFDEKVTSSYIEKKLSKKYDVIVCKPVEYSFPIYLDFCYYVTAENGAIVLDTLLQLYPNYKDAVAEYFGGNKIIPCNMFISSWDWMMDYCNWLFPILEKLEIRILKSQYSRQNRTLAYAGEYLLGVYLTHNKSKVDYVTMNSTVINKENKIKKTIRIYLMNILFSFIYRGITSSFFKRNRVKKMDFNEAVLVGLRNDGIELNSLLEAYKDK